MSAKGAQFLHLTCPAASRLCSSSVTALVLLLCFNVLPDNFAVMNFSALPLSAVVCFCLPA